VIARNSILGKLANSVCTQGGQNTIEKHMKYLENALHISSSKVSLPTVFETFSWFNTFNRHYVLWCSRMKEYIKLIILFIFHAMSH